MCTRPLSSFGYIIVNPSFLNPQSSLRSLPAGFGSAIFAPGSGASSEERVRALARGYAAELRERLAAELPRLPIGRYGGIAWECTCQLNVWRWGAGANPGNGGGGEGVLSSGIVCALRMEGWECPRYRPRGRMPPGPAPCRCVPSCPVLLALRAVAPNPLPLAATPRCIALYRSWNITLGTPHGTRCPCMWTARRCSNALRYVLFRCSVDRSTRLSSLLLPFLLPHSDAALHYIESRNAKYTRRVSLEELQHGGQGGGGGAGGMAGAAAGGSGVAQDTRGPLERLEVRVGTGRLRELRCTGTLGTVLNKVGRHLHTLRSP